MTLTHKVMDTGPLGMGLVFLQNLSNTYGSFYGVLLAAGMCLDGSYLYS